MSVLVLGGGSRGGQTVSLQVGVDVRMGWCVVGVDVERSGVQPAPAGHLAGRGSRGHVVDSRAVGEGGCEGEEEGEGEEEVEEAEGVEMHLGYLEIEIEIWGWGFWYSSP